MIVVLDTNVYISAFLSSSGVPARIIEFWEKDEFQVAFSPALLEELKRVLEYDKIKKYFSQTQGNLPQLLKHLQAMGIMVRSKLKLNVIAADPDDDRVLECALVVGAKYIISGDEHLLSLKKYQGIEILSPTQFLTLLNLGTHHTQDRRLKNLYAKHQFENIGNPVRSKKQEKAN